MMTKTLWNSLDSLSSLAGVLADWRREMGADFDAARGYLRPTGEVSTSFPCTHQPVCGCYHEVNPHAQGVLFAACRCDDGDCPPIRLEPTDLIVHALNTRKLGDSIRVALGFEPAPTEPAHDLRKSLRIGTYGALHTPVFFFCPYDEAALLRELADLWNPGVVPFILLTPTRNCHSATVEATIHRSSSLLISCSVTLAVEAGGKLRVIRPIGPLLQDFVNRQAEGPALAKTVESIGKDIRAIATNTYELRKENEDLRRLASDGYFKFVLTVDPLDFRYFAAIFAKGDRAKAAQLFEDEIGKRRFYERIDSWKSRGPEYKRMYRIVEARKNAGRHGKIRLNESLQSASVQDEAENPDTLQAVLDKLHADNLDRRGFPALLQDILSALLDMNENNWRAIRDELVPAIREDVPQ